MSESIAARVDDSTARWLEEVAEQEDTTISKLVATILEQHSRDVDDEPDSTEMKFNQLEERIMELEQDISLLVNHAESLEQMLAENSANTNSLEVVGNELEFPKLPRNSDGNEYDTTEFKERSPTIDPTYRL